MVWDSIGRLVCWWLISIPEDRQSAREFGRAMWSSASTAARVISPSDFQFRLATRKVGEVSRCLGLWRRGTTVGVKLPLEVAPEDPPRNVQALTSLHPLQGAVIANLSPALAEEIDYIGLAQGVIVLRVARGSQAGRFGYTARRCPGRDQRAACPACAGRGEYAARSAQIMGHQHAPGKWHGVPDQGAPYLTWPACSKAQVWNSWPPPAGGQVAAGNTGRCCRSGASDCS